MDYLLANDVFTYRHVTVGIAKIRTRVDFIRDKRYVKGDKKGRIFR